MKSFPSALNRDTGFLFCEHHWDSLYLLAREEDGKLLFQRTLSKCQSSEKLTLLLFFCYSFYFTIFTLWKHTQYPFISHWELITQKHALNP